jgi:hypothetical protein
MRQARFPVSNACSAVPLSPVGLRERPAGPACWTSAPQRDRIMEKFDRKEAREKKKEAAASAQAATPAPKRPAREEVRPLDCWPAPRKPLSLTEARTQAAAHALAPCMAGRPPFPASPRWCQPWPRGVEPRLCRLGAVGQTTQPAHLLHWTAYLTCILMPRYLPDAGGGPGGGGGQARGQPAQRAPRRAVRQEVRQPSPVRAAVRGSLSWLPPLRCAPGACIGAGLGGLGLPRS